MYEKKVNYRIFKKKIRNTDIQYNNMYLFQMHMIRFISFFLFALHTEIIIR